MAGLPYHRTMAAPRLTVRQLQERKQQAGAALERCQMVIQVWQSMGREVALRSGKEPEMWAEIHTQVMESVALARAAFPNDRLKVGPLHSNVESWKSWAQPTHGRRSTQTARHNIHAGGGHPARLGHLLRPHPPRAVPILKEAKDVLTPPRNDVEAETLAYAATALAHLYVDLGWLEEAMALNRETLAVNWGSIVCNVSALIGLARAR